MGSQGQLRAAGDEDGVTDELEVSAREVKELQDPDVNTEEEAEPDLPGWGAMKEVPQGEISDHLNKEQRASLRQLLEESNRHQIRLGWTQVTEQ